MVFLVSRSPGRLTKVPHCMDSDHLGPLTGARPGERWVIRRRLPDGSATDVIGWINQLSDLAVESQPSATAPALWIGTDSVIAARRVPAAAGGPDPMRTSAEDLEQIALPGWLAEHESLGEWTLRSAGGFTGRANSGLAVGDPGSTTPPRPAGSARTPPRTASNRGPR